MSLNWRWDDKCGEATFVEKRGDAEREFTVNLYTGNACLIFINEWKEGDEDKYMLWTFWADKQHMKNCLGLYKKGRYTKNLYNDSGCRFTKFKLDKKKCRYFKDIIDALTKAFDNITIEVYSSGDREG